MLLFAVEKESKVGLIVKISLLVLAGVGAIYFAVRGGGDADQQLNTKESEAAYICLEDGHVFRLTPYMWSQPGQTQTKEGGETGVRSRAITMVKCPQCTKFSAVLALECPDGKVIASVDKNGQFVDCPQ